MMCDELLFDFLFLPIGRGSFSFFLLTWILMAFSITSSSSVLSSTEMRVREMKEVSECESVNLTDSISIPRRLAHSLTPHHITERSIPEATTVLSLH